MSTTIETTTTANKATTTANKATTAAPAAQDPVREKERVELRLPGRDTDFNEKYLPDRALGRELDDTARVWKVYRGEAIDYDDALLKTWNDTVNILLTFAGLFSAAVTSFVIASTDDLKPDPNAYIANLLFAMGDATAGSTSPFANLPVPPPLDAAPTSLARIVNGFWYISLFLSLAAALLCILVKQWLDEYTARTRGSAKHPHEWAQRRSFYFQGLDDWNVAAIISFLPLFLHLALFLFLAGLTAFLWDLDRDIRWVMLILVSLLLAFYAVFLLLPVWSAACPYATPLLAQLSNLGYMTLVGVCILRKWALSCRTAVNPVIHRLLCRRYPATDIEPSEGGTPPPDVGPLEGGVLTPDKQIQLLLEQRSRRHFQGVLHRITEIERQKPEPERGDFEAQLDCSVLSWLIHDVSDSDAVAVAWQSLGALIEQPESRRYTCMVAVLQKSKFVGELGGETEIWRTLRMDGILDDMQLSRITRSALFLAAALKFQLHLILPYTHSSDEGWADRTLSPDAALIYAHSVDSTRAAQVVQRLHEKGLHRPLPSTAKFILRRLLPNHGYFAPEAVIASLYYCELTFLDLTPKLWTRVAKVLRSDHAHLCAASCAVNALAARALQLIAHETSGSSNTSQISVTPFDAHSLVQLIVRYLPAVTSCSAELSAAMWAILTDTRFLSSRMQRANRIRGTDWAYALSHLSTLKDGLYATFAVQYNSIWGGLLRGSLRDHPPVILDEGIDFDDSVERILWPLTTALEQLTPWATISPSTLRSALTLAESASIAFCSVDRDSTVALYIKTLVRSLPLVVLFPTDLALTLEEHNEWVDVFVSAVQHFMVLDPRPWIDLRGAVTVSTNNDVRTFFREVYARLTKAGPCRKGACAGKAPRDSDWPSNLGPKI